MSEPRISILKYYIFPILASITTGIIASHLAINRTVAVIETKLTYVESNLDYLKKLNYDINSNKIELATLTQRVRSLENALASRVTLVKEIRALGQNVQD